MDNGLPAGTNFSPDTSEGKYSALTDREPSDAVV